MIKSVSNSLSFFTNLIILFISFQNTTLKAQPMPYIEKKSETFILPQTNSTMCHASTLVELSNGDLMAAWFQGSYEGARDVSVWGSFYHENQWSIPQQLAIGFNRSNLIQDRSDTLACWNPVLFKSPENIIYLYYKVGKSPREWWGESISSGDDGKTWNTPTLLSPQLGPVKNKPLITTSGTWLFPTSTETLDDWNVFIERSSNQGNTWETIAVDTFNSAKVIQPTLIQYPDGSVHALCRSNQNVIMESVSTDDGKTWTPFTKTKILNPNSGIDAISKKNGVTFLVYNPMESGSEWVNGRNQLVIAISFDGLEWFDIYRLENEKNGEYSYPAIIQTSDGLIHISYTYNRKNIKHLIFKSNF